MRNSEKDLADSLEEWARTQPFRLHTGETWERILFGGARTIMAGSLPAECTRELAREEVAPGGPGVREEAESWQQLGWWPLAYQERLTVHRSPWPEVTLAQLMLVAAWRLHEGGLFIPASWPPQTAAMSMWHPVLALFLHEDGHSVRAEWEARRVWTALEGG